MGIYQQNPNDHQFNFIFFVRFLVLSPTPLPLFRFCSKYNGLSKPCKKSTGESFFVTCFMSPISRHAIGWLSLSGSSSIHLFMPGSAGKDAMTRSRLNRPASVRRWGSWEREWHVLVMRDGQLMGEKGSPSCRCRRQLTNSKIKHRAFFLPCQGRT